MATAATTAVGAASFQGLTDKLACIIYLLNTSNMTAAQIASGAKSFQGLTDKYACIIYLLASGAGGGGASGIATGEGSPITGGVSTVANKVYIDDTNPASPSIWVVSNGSWVQVIA